MMVFWILVPAFVAVGVHLIWYSGRVRRMVADFARARGLTYRSRDDNRFETVLGEALKFDEPGLVRSFGQFRDIVQDNNALTVWTSRPPHS